MASWSFDSFWCCMAGYDLCDCWVVVKTLTYFVIKLIHTYHIWSMKPIRKLYGIVAHDLASKYQEYKNTCLANTWINYRCLCEYYIYIYITMLNMQVIAPKGINTYSINLPWTFHYSALISNLYSIKLWICHYNLLYSILSPYPNELSPWTGRLSVSRFEAPCRQCIDSEVLDETRVPGAGWWYTYPCEKYDSQLGRMTSHMWNGK